MPLSVEEVFSIRLSGVGIFRSFFIPSTCSMQLSFIYMVGFFTC